MTGIAPTAMLDSLKELCARKETGRLDIRKGPFGGTVYLQSGHIIDVDVQGRKGPEALGELIGLRDTILYWFQGATPYRHTCYITPAELEALAQGPRVPAEGARRPTEPSPATTQARGLGVAMPRLAEYEIVLQATDPAHRPNQRVLGQPLKPAYLIGASPDCDIQIDHYSVCQMHAALIIEDDMIRLWDLGSHNATHLNGDLVEEGLVQSGDTLQIGDIAFRVTLRALRSAPAHQPGAARPTFRPPPNAPIPSGPLRFETIRQERKRAEMADNPLFKLFGAKRSDKTPRR